MAVKHELKYNIIREALGEYLNNNTVIPLYNKKQIKEESYKLEDLEKNRAYLVDKVKSKDLETLVPFDVSDFAKLLHSLIHRDTFSFPLQCLVTREGKKTNDYVRVKIVDSEGDNRLENMFYLAKSILEHSRVFEYMTKKHKTALQEIVNSMLDE